MAWLGNAGVLTSFCFLAARSTWILLSPGEVVLLPRSHVVSNRDVDAVEAAHVFGEGKEVAAELPPGLRLDGVFTPGKGSSGAAIFVSAVRGSQVVLAGEEVSPGFFLEEVAGDHVVLKHGATTVMLRIEKIAPEVDLGIK
ncbi:MAG: hypothetical protein HKL98_06335 [Burkholderiales bacterium]|nr:hypothetical protein [Burkholderiales bacterium]